MVQAQQSTGMGHIWLAIRDPEKIHMTTSVTSVALVERHGKRTGKGYRSDTVEGFHGGGVFSQLSQ